MAMFIYALAEQNGTVRYVGKSAKPRRRFANHRGQRATPVMRAWVGRLRLLGIEPTLLVLHEVPAGHDPAQWERYFIGLFSRVGNILNCQGVDRLRRALPPRVCSRRCRFCRSVNHFGNRCPHREAA